MTLLKCALSDHQSRATKLLHWRVSNSSTVPTSSAKVRKPLMLWRHRYSMRRFGFSGGTDVQHFWSAGRASSWVCRYLHLRVTLSVERLLLSKLDRPEWVVNRRSSPQTRLRQFPPRDHTAHPSQFCRRRLCEAHPVFAARRCSTKAVIFSPHHYAFARRP